MKINKSPVLRYFAYKFVLDNRRPIVINMQTNETQFHNMKPNTSILTIEY
jgi:hypothetical protein